jgi:hypothetical protein
MKIGVTVILILGVSGFSSRIEVSAFAKKIQNTFNTIRHFESIYDSYGMDSVADSVVKYNSELEKELSSSKFGLLDSSDLKYIAKSTEININTSPNKNLMLVSWSVFVNQAIPACSNIIWINHLVPKKLSEDQEGESDFNGDVKFDKILDFNIHDSSYFVVLGTRKCGNLCIMNIIRAFSIGDKLSIKAAKIFYDGNRNFSEVEFSYILNIETRQEPVFRILKDRLICPTFNDTKTKVVGEKVYQIVYFHNDSVRREK